MRNAQLVHSGAIWKEKTGIQAHYRRKSHYHREIHISEVEQMRATIAVLAIIASYTVVDSLEDYFEANGQDTTIEEYEEVQEEEIQELNFDD